MPQTSTYPGFSQMTKWELMQVIDYYKVPITKKETKDQLFDLLVGSGITWIGWQRDLGLAPPKRKKNREVEEIKKDESGKRPVLMMRENPEYEIMGYTFTRENPFCICTDSDAEYIVNNVEGFRFASIAEVKRYYAL